MTVDHEVAERQKPPMPDTKVFENDAISADILDAYLPEIRASRQ
eukprot:SAG31_NODE_35089_length_326_cov_0.938326_1_plen_44_part_00